MHEREKSYPAVKVYLLNVTPRSDPPRSRVSKGRGPRGMLGPHKHVAEHKRATGGHRGWSAYGEVSKAKAEG